jgi:hypothetical protein
MITKALLSEVSKVATVVVTLVALSGCATTAQIDAGVGRFNYRPVSEALVVWGHPSSVDVVDDMKYYIWSDNTQAYMPMYQTNSTTGYVSGQYVNLSTPATTMIPVRYTCERTLIVDSSNIVHGSSWRGNHCNVYAAR